MTEVERAAWNRSHPGGTEILPGSLEKDAVENHVHDEICFDVPNAKMSSLYKKYPPTISITLKRGQDILATDWYDCYLKMLKNDPCQRLSGIERVKHRQSSRPRGEASRTSHRQPWPTTPPMKTTTTRYVTHSQSFGKNNL
jgi:hypothetical protein